MGVKVITLSEQESYWSAIREASAVLEDGGVVVFPTETVYGIGARADRPRAMTKLRQAKGREGAKPFTVHIARRRDAERYVPVMNRLARRFARKGWPGPLTMILAVPDPRSAAVAAEYDDDTLAAIYNENAIGLRCPDDAIARDLLAEAKGPVVAASANLAGHSPPRTINEALKGLSEFVDVALDGGAAVYSRASTIVRVGENDFEVVREGVIDERMLKEFATVNLLFVCSGNTCRSPIATGLARRIVAERLDCDPERLEDRDVRIASAGVFAAAGLPAAENAKEVLARRGIDISRHRSQPLTVELVNRADYVFVMTPVHRAEVAALVPSAADRIIVLGDDEEIADPIGKDLEAYERSAQTIERVLERRLTEIEL